MFGLRQNNREAGFFLEKREEKYKIRVYLLRLIVYDKWEVETISATFVGNS